MATPKKGSAVIVGVGPSRGLGAALCRRFSAGGYHVFVAARNTQKLAPVAEEIEAAGGTITLVATDATEEFQVKNLMDQAEHSAGGLQVAVYNAEHHARVDPLDVSVDVFEQTWKVTCLGGLLTAREAASRMLARNSGTILFTGATASLKARPAFIAFASAKFALRAVAQAFARDLGPRGIHIGHVVIDGVIDGMSALNTLPNIKAELGEDGLLNVDEIATAYWNLHTQEPSAWTFELDLRPFKETF